MDSVCVKCLHKTLQETEGLVALLIFDKGCLSSPTSTVLAAAQYRSEGERWVFKSAAHSNCQLFISLLLFPVFNPPNVLSINMIEIKIMQAGNNCRQAGNIMQAGNNMLVGIKAEGSHLHQRDAVAHHVRIHFIRASSGAQTQKKIPFHVL